MNWEKFKEDIQNQLRKLSVEPASYISGCEEEVLKYILLLNIEENPALPPISDQFEFIKTTTNQFGIIQGAHKKYIIKLHS